ncbi:hypothetical protein [Sphingobium sp.]|uniref:hypothetical protein n=1 Tax=Sphingobium sp. TaxID=1912891 RepID=UPI003BB4BDB5
MYTEKQDGEPVTHVSEVEAKGGSRTRVTRNILVISLALIVILFIATVGFGFFKTGQTGADDVNNGTAAQTSGQMNGAQ